ncbi:Biotin synthase [hydrothermal vent metagenome]|uniref:biotin synthase n=1 Tax=hydrothermal vent metagenome TaxID=652676 RepID=A0A3B0YZC7_9ZZZZ
MTKMKSTIRNDWTLDEINFILSQPFNDLMFNAQTVHRQNFDPNKVQISTLLNIKTGGCPEDCGYCSQSAHYNTGLEKETLMEKQKIIDAALEAKQQGASRFCMGAAWRKPHARDMQFLCEVIDGIKDLGMETCMTLGMLDSEQAQQLQGAGLDYYNHNLDTSPEYYDKVITTRTYNDRLETLAHVRDAGMNVCSGGIIGMGEQSQDRASLLQQLANLDHHPESVPINMLIQVEGTPLGEVAGIDPIDFIRMIAAARIIMPKSFVRLSAGRTEMTDETQALCFMAGANSIFYGERLLTADNPETDHDQRLFARLGLTSLEVNQEQSSH